MGYAKGKMLIAAVLLSAWSSGAQTQPVVPSVQTGKPAPKSSPLVLTGIIPLPNVQGRIDHLSFDPKGRLFVSALGNDSEEVVDLVAGIRAHSIGGIPRPQGVVYVPEAHKLFVGSDEGKLYVYDANSLGLVTSIDFGDDVDNLRYDEKSKSVYVGYGDGEAGAIGAVDVTTNQRLPREYKLGAHPESFQLETAGPRIYVNLPDRKEIAVIDRNSGTLVHWPMTFESNFPMALDEAGHRLFVATRAPARLAVFDTVTGRMVTDLPCAQDSDDLYFDAARRRVYVAGGEGYISVFQEKDPARYEWIANVASAVGARTAGYFGKGHKGFDRFYVAVPARAEVGAEVLVYTVQD
jgi:DNA-binding beta-propeller fold protein YncE